MRKRIGKAKQVSHSSQPNGNRPAALTRIATDPNSDKPRLHHLLPSKCSLCLLVLVAIYVTIPITLRLSHGLQSKIIYVNFIPLPFTGNLSHPSEFNIRNTRHQCIKQFDGASVCFWHVLPIKYSTMSPSTELFPSYLSDGLPIIIYGHGNTGSRAVYHRVELYKLLARKNFHVIAFDYRGFGDSGGIATEFGLSEDMFLMWNWTVSRAPKSKIIIFGHSLGCAPTTQIAGLLGNHSSLSGVILDAPYTTIREAAYHHPFGIPYWPFMSLFMEDFVFGQFKEKFPVIEYVKNVHCPIVIFHGEKDMIIPYHLGYNVFLNAQKYGRSSNVTFYSCGSTTHKKNYLSQIFHSTLDSIAQLCEP